MLLFCSVNEHEINIKSNMDSDTRGSRGKGSVSNTMADYCTGIP